jgi:hypothetical protein
MTPVPVVPHPMGSRIVVGSGFPDHRSADEISAREPQAPAFYKRLTEKKAPDCRIRFGRIGLM